MKVSLLAQGEGRLRPIDGATMRRQGTHSDSSDEGQDGLYVYLKGQKAPLHRHAFSMTEQRADLTLSTSHLSGRHDSRFCIKMSLVLDGSVIDEAFTLPFTAVSKLLRSHLGPMTCSLPMASETCERSVRKCRRSSPGKLSYGALWEGGDDLYEEDEGAKEGEDEDIASQPSQGNEDNTAETEEPERKSQRTSYAQGLRASSRKDVSSQSDNQARKALRASPIGFI